MTDLLALDAFAARLAVRAAVDGILLMSSTTSGTRNFTVRLPILNEP